MIYGNKYIDLDDFDTIQFKVILDDMHNFLKVSGRKKKSAERCRGNSLLEPAVFESYKHWDNPWALSNAHLKDGMKILDCGSGRGALQFYLASKGLDVYSVDISNNRSRLIKNMQRQSKKIGIRYSISPNTVHRKLNKKYKVNVKFKQESADALSFPDNVFDRIFCISVLEHMENKVIDKSMKEMERVLKPGGLLLLTFDFHPFPTDSIIGFTEEEFRSNVLEKCNLQIVANEPDFTTTEWNHYIKSINKFFRTNNPNTSFGIVLQKQIVAKIC